MKKYFNLSILCFALGIFTTFVSAKCLNFSLLNAIPGSVPTDNLNNCAISIIGNDDSVANTDPSKNSSIDKGKENYGNFNEIYISNINDIREEVFSKDENLEKVSLKNINKVSERAFENCHNLKELYISEVYSINENAFSHCENLENVYIDGLISISKNAFSDCKNLKNIYIKTDFSNFKLENQCKLSIFKFALNIIEDILKSSYKNINICRI